MQSINQSPELMQSKNRMTTTTALQQTKTLMRRPTDQRPKSPIAPDPALRHRSQSHRIQRCLGTEALPQDDRWSHGILANSFVRQLAFPSQLNSGDERPSNDPVRPGRIRESSLESIHSQFCLSPPRLPCSVDA